MKDKYKKLLFSLLLLILIFLLLVYLISKDTHVSFNKITYHQFLQDVQDGKINSVIIKPKKIIACYSKHNCVETVKPIQDNHLLNLLTKQRIEITGQPSSLFVSSIQAWWPILLFYVVVTVLIVLLLIVFVKHKYRKNK